MLNREKNLLVLTTFHNAVNGRTPKLDKFSLNDLFTMCVSQLLGTMSNRLAMQLVDCQVSNCVPSGETNQLRMFLQEDLWRRHEGSERWNRLRRRQTRMRSSLADVIRNSELGSFGLSADGTSVLGRMTKMGRRLGAVIGRVVIDVIGIHKMIESSLR